MDIHIYNFIPQNLKQQLVKRLANTMVQWAGEGDSHQLAKTVRKIGKDSAFYQSLDEAMKNGINRFIAEYDDEDIVEAITSDSSFWQSLTIHNTLMKMVSQPVASAADEQDTTAQHFADILPELVDREQVDRAITYLLRCIVEKLWALPGARQVRDIYSSQIQAVTAESAMKQVVLAQVQLLTQNQLSRVTRDALLQLATTIVEQKAHPAPPEEADSTYNNQTLYDAMSRHLYIDDVRLLSWHLREASSLLRELDPDNLPLGKREMLLGLVEYCEQHNALAVLVTVLKQEFPQVLADYFTYISSPLPSPASRLYHNLPQPDYYSFVGRERELHWLRQRLSPKDRVWLISITGIGGVGKSALALAVAHEYLTRYHELSEDERFDAIVWVSAKEEVLAVNGVETAALSGQTFRTLDDIYTTIAQTLEREDITRARSEDRDALVQKALQGQRTLLVVDNLERVNDKRVQVFLRNLPSPSKVIITSRKSVELAYELRLTGLSQEEAEGMISHEAVLQGLELDLEQRRQLFERTGGLPLAIKLVVTRLVSDDTFEQVIRWLGDAEGDLTDYCIKGQADLVRERNNSAWKLLLACSLFDRDRGVSRETLGVIAGLSMADRDEGLTMLQRLSLINRNVDDVFRMMPLVQSYAKDQIETAYFGEEMVKRWENVNGSRERHQEQI